MSRQIATDKPTPPSLLRHPGWFDAAVLVVIGLIVVVETLTISMAGVPEGLAPLSREGWEPGGYIALGVCLAGLLTAWKRPWAGLIIIAAAPVVSAALGWDPIATWNIAVFATLWLTLRVLPGLPAGLLVGAANFCAAAWAQSGFSLQEPVPSIAALAAIAAAGTGSAIRGHRLYRAQLEERAEQALATREAEADRRVAVERLRIARDLHDVVGHELALISMRLGAAEVHLPEGSELARTDLAAVRTSVQSVLASTQQILEVLRTDGQDDERTPAAGFEHITELVAMAREAGLAIEATVAQPPPELTTSVSAAAYRIVQEALTNAQRHSTGAVSLRVEVGEEALTIETANVKRHLPATDLPAARSGFGLVGMQERAASVGGWVDTREDDRMFWLWVYLPIAGKGQN